LEWLVESYGRTSDSFRLPDALAQLGDALVAAKQYDRAKQVLEQLVDREPESDSAKRKLNDVLRKMGLLAGEEPAPAPPEVHELELPKAPAPKVRPDMPSAKPAETAKAKTYNEPALDEDTQKFIAQSLTDVDLFASYGLTQKAIGLLEAILRRAPRHTPTLEKLLDFVLGAGDDRRTAELASHLEQIHQERGDTRSAERFGELRRRFQRAAGLTDEELTPAPAAQPVVPEVSADAAELAQELPLPEPEGELTSEIPVALEAPTEELEVLPEAPAAPERAEEISASQPQAARELQEVDLSDEWASLLDESADSVTASADANTHQAATEEIETFELPESAPAAGAETHTEFSVASQSSAPEVEEFFIDEEPQPHSAPEPAKPVESHSSVLPLEVPEEPEFAVSDSPTAQSEPVAEHFAGVSGELPSASEPEAAAHEAPQEVSAESPAIEEIAPDHPEHAARADADSLEAHLAELHLPHDVVGETSVHQKAEQLAEQPLELELDQDYELVLDHEQLVPAYDQKPPDVPLAVAPEEEYRDAPQESAPPEPVSAAAENFTADQFLADLASEMGELGIGAFGPESSLPVESATHSADASRSESTAADGHPAPLKEVFDDFRAELGEMSSDDEDLETHYNLGVAFREMGLLEEAISEFQKVAQACDRGRPFRYAMQCCTLLGLAFIEKGQPGMAAIWYERALQTPGLGPDNDLALRYDLGLAQESAGNHEAALKSFAHVYAMNIDYRDVAERIAALQKPSR
ncbi:MAG: tetratricopeptide repeat protein, partial [Candidatus Acidiferrum sp.]